MFEVQPGFYRVGDRIFYSKIQALTEATKTNSLPYWNFGDDVFSLVDWSSGHCPDIRHLYQQRARQLREKYDYLVLSYSGGSDSWTMLQSFLTANQKVDEILVRWPFKATNDLFIVNRNSHASNILSEWELNIKPDLDYIDRVHPDIKITVYDWSDDINNELVEEDWLNINDHMNPGVFRKFNVYGGKERQMLDAGKKTAIVWGVDKPQVRYFDDKLHLYFQDKLVNNRCASVQDDRTAELFYWTPDMPSLVHGQARMLYEYFVSNPDKVHLAEWEGRTHESKREYDKLIRSIVYPDWNPAKFQADKPNSMVWNECDSWMFSELKSHRYYQGWEHDLNSIKNAVDRKFHQVSTSGRFEGWTGFASPMYNLGPIYKSLDI